MGAKTPAKVKLRRPTYKCDICHRKLLSAQALKTHKYSSHKITASHSDQRPKTVKTKPKKAVTEKPKPPTNDVGVETKELMPQNISDVRKIEFECPVCNVTFAAYYPAYRHIQKLHCINNRGQKVDPTSMELVKPLRAEICSKCNKRVRGNDAHACWELPLQHPSGLEVMYSCMGCKQQFNSMQLFDLHVSGLHSEGVESMFFPSMNEFLNWKMQMQIKTNVEYLILAKCNSKQTYRCTYLPPSETTRNVTVSNICPSSIVVQEFTKGVQVHFYKLHHGHKCPEYVCPEKYKKFLITSLMSGKNIQSYNVEYDEKDIYCQFKVLLESIIVEAAKVKVHDLRLMLEKALEMTSILNNYDEEDDAIITYPNRKKLGEKQISKALDNIKFQVKRKIDDSNDDNDDNEKKKEVTPKIVNAFSIAAKKSKKEDVVSKKDVVKEDKPIKAEVPSTRILRNSQTQSSPSFNDSYKDFVDKNFLGKVVPAENSKPSRQTLGRSPKALVKRVWPVPNPKARLRPLNKLVEPSQIEEELAKDFIEAVPNTIKDDTYTSKIKDKPTVGSEITIKKVVPKENEGSKDSRVKVREPTIIPVIRKDNIPRTKSKDSIDKANQQTKEVKIPVIRKENTPRTKSKDSIDKANLQTKEDKIPVIRKENTPRTKSKDSIDKANQQTKEVTTPMIRKENTPKTKPKKQVMKTKIGQFKPSLSPKSESPKKPDLNTSFGKIKPDIEYEVKEQENDCNILILKI